MGLAELINQETGVNFEHIMLLRHFNRIHTLIQLGGTVEEFTSLQLAGTKWDFWRDGRPQIEVVVVIVHDVVYGVYRILGVEAEGTLDDLAGEAHQDFLIEGEDWREDLQVRRFSMERIPSVATNRPITGWKGREISALLRSDGNLFWEIEVNLENTV